MLGKGVVAATILCLAACGKDPILAAAERAKATDKRVLDDVAGPGPAAAATPAGTPGAEGQMSAGIPAEPSPGSPADPGPGTPGAVVPGSAEPVGEGIPAAPTPVRPPDPPPGKPTDPPPGLAGSPGRIVGPSVTISGDVVWADWKTGRVRVTAFDADHASRPKTPPQILAATELDRPGSFTIEVPENAGKVYMAAEVDENGDGRPGPLDPQGNADRFPISVSTSDIAGLTISLSKRDPPPGGIGEDF